MENEKNFDELKDEAVPAETQASAEGTVPAEQSDPVAEAAVPAEDAVPAETATEQHQPAAKTDKATPGKIALLIVAIVLVAALIVGLLASGQSGKVEEPTPAETDAESIAATVPADGNPDDATCKGTYTVSDEQVAANMDTVVATAGEHSLTNSELQVFYWMQVQNFLASEFGSSIMYYGALDYTQSLDTQLCVLEEGLTWQQFFLKEALNSWQTYCALAEKAEQAGMQLPEESLQLLENLESELALSAQYQGIESVEALMKRNVGAGATVKDYAAFQELLMQGNLYYDAEYAKLTVTQEEMEAFFADHEDDYGQTGITRDGTYVDVRHILVMPQGGTADENGAITYSEEEWKTCEEEADGILQQWLAGEQTEEAFAALANERSEDPGSNTNGGLYQNVYEGQMVAEFEDWCFDESREYGNTGIVRTSYGYHVMYYVRSTPIWEYYARQDLLMEKSVAMMEALTAEYPITVDYKAITLGSVNLAG